MYHRLLPVRIALFLVALVMTAAACASPGPTTTPWIIVVTATPAPPRTPTTVPTGTPVPTGMPVPTSTLVPTATRGPTLPPLTPTPPPPPTPTLPTPVVQIIAPANGTPYSVGQVVNVQFTAGDQSGITVVELYVGGTRVAYKEYPQRPTRIDSDSLNWTTTAAGNYTLQVNAYNAFNKASTPDQRNIVVQPSVTVPTVQMNYPTQRVVIVAGQVIQIQATINDVVGIQGLDLVERIGGQEVVYTSDPAYRGVPFVWQVGWQSRNTGDHTLFVRARNVNGGVGQSNDFVIGVADPYPPQMQVSYSTTTPTQGTDLRVHVEAVDSKGVKEIRLYVDGNVVATWFAPDQSVGQSQVSTDLWWRNAGPVGTHFAHVWAQDTTGLQAQSPDQGIQVVTVPPTPIQVRQASYSATSLNQGSDLRVDVLAVAGNGVKEIRLYVDDGVVATWLAPDPSVGQSQVSTALWWRNVEPAGNHTAYVWAQDTTGGWAQSPDQRIRVVAVSPTPTPVPPTPNLVGGWGGRPIPAESFIVTITSQQGNNLQGTLTFRPAQGAAVTGPLFNSTIQGNNVTIHAQLGSETYNFILTLSADGQHMSGSWSTMHTGLLQPITFDRL